jgi:hypothetical protein
MLTKQIQELILWFVKYFELKKNLFPTLIFFNLLH